MKLPIIDGNLNKKGQQELPKQFEEAYRPDLIKRAVHAYLSSQRQRYGAFPLAGLRHSAKTSKRRRDYRGTYGMGISRVARKIMSRRGMRMGWVGAFSPQTTGGHRSHPPKASKILEQKINLQEKRKAIRSAMAATMNKELVAQRGHKIPEGYPFIVDSSFEQLGKTKELFAVLEKLGFGDDLQRSAQKSVRAGKGKRRGRKYQRKKGPLIVVEGDCPLLRSARNVPGIDVVSVLSLNANMLAPGTHPGRLTLWTSGAVKQITDKKMFM